MSLALNELCWEPLETDRAKSEAMMMYKILNNMGPTNLCEFFTYEKTHYNLRGNSSSLPTKTEHKQYEKSFEYNGAFLWNSIPQKIRECTTLKSFKRKISICNTI